tara:strand:+ start:13669 stop:14592 length:924 start_codon:yes stop_codon:yes gene_type:complete
MATSNATLFLNAYEKTLTYKGIQKEINDSYWEEHIVPILYPLWDSDKDRLELFVYRENGQYLIEKNKYTKNFKTGESKWVSYEFDPNGVDLLSVTELYESLKEKFLDFKELSEAEYETAVQKKFAVGQILTWNKVKLVRLFLLQDSDYTQLPDSPCTDEERALWKQYRNYLRDFLTLQTPQSPYDVIFPITPTEYLSRKGFELSPIQVEVYGQQGSDEDYLTSGYHFWKLSSNALKSFAQRMSTYVALRTLTAENDKFGRVEVKKWIAPDNQITQGIRNTLEVEHGSQESAESYLDQLMKRIENGEV